MSVKRSEPSGAQPDDPHITDHAVLRYLSRCDPTAKYPRAEIRRAWHDSEPAVERSDARDGHGIRLIYTVDDEQTTILTVYGGQNE